MPFVLMQHPLLPPSRTIRVPEEVIAGHQQAGWEIVPEAPEDDSLVPVTVSETDLTPAEPDNPADLSSDDSAS